MLEDTSLQRPQTSDGGLQPRVHRHLAGDRIKLLRHQEQVP